MTCGGHGRESLNGSDGGGSVRSGRRAARMQGGEMTGGTYAGAGALVAKHKRRGVRCGGSRQVDIRPKGCEALGTAGPRRGGEVGRLSWVRQIAPGSPKGRTGW